MTEKERALWEAIRRFSFDETIEEYGFETRLAFENKWTGFVTKQAIEEYKKFMFLASVSNHMVSPSEIVDIVWHQHLIFSKSYDKLCQILGKKIEHIPSTHNPHNRVIFTTAKQHTDTLYESYFGMQNPYFWDNNYLKEIQLISNDADLRKRVLQIVSISVILYFPIYLLLKPYLITIENPHFILYTIISTLFIFTFLYLQVKKVVQVGAEKLYRDNFHVKNLNVAEIFCLQSGNNSKYVHANVDNMIKKRLIRTESNWGIKQDLNSVFTSNEEIAVGNVFKDWKPLNYSSLFQQLKEKELFLVPQQAMNNLKRNIVNSSYFINLFTVLILILLPLLYLLLIRLQLGIERAKPVTFLLIEIVVYFWVGICFLKNVFKEIFAKTIPNLYQSKIKSEERIDLKLSWEWKYLIHGAAYYNDDFLSMVEPIQKRINSTNSSWSSCGSGCSSSCGSSCGGGCGGCGGD